MTEVYDAYSMPSAPKRGRKAEWPFDEIAVGQFFVVDDPSRHTTMRVYASQRGKALGKKFRCQKNGDQLFIQRTA